MAFSKVAPFVQPALQAAGGIYQLIRANQLKKSLGERPEYNTPESQVQRLENAKREGYSDLAGRSILEGNIAESTASGVSNVKDMASSSSGALQAVLGLKGQEQDQLTNLGLAAAQDRERKQAMLRGELGIDAQYQDKAFDMNEMQPYQDKASAIAALKGSGMQNLFSGGAGASNAGVTLENQKAWQDYLARQSGTNPTNNNYNYNNQGTLVDEGLLLG